MDWDDEVVCRTVDRSVARRLQWSDDGPERRDVLWTPFHNAHIDDRQLLLAPRCRIDDTRKSLWLPELLELARDRGCSTIRCLTTNQLTPAHHEQTMLDHGFTVEAEGHVLGADVDSLNFFTPQHLVEVTGSRRSLAAVFQLSSTLWGTPSMGQEEIDAVSEALEYVPLDERNKHDVVVWLDGQPAAIGLLMVDDAIGTLENGATLPEYQRQGAYSAAVDGRLMLARDAGCQRVLTHTENEFAEKVLRSRGLRTADETKLYILSL